MAPEKEGITKELMRTAYHEAGHVVAKLAQLRTVKSATIVSTDDYLGAVRSENKTFGLSPDVSTS